MLPIKNKAANWSIQSLVVTVYTTYCNSKMFGSCLHRTCIASRCFLRGWKLNFIYEIWAGDLEHLECFVASSGKLLPTFRRSTLPASSWSNNPSTAKMNALRSMEIQNTAACQKSWKVRIFLLAEIRDQKVKWQTVCKCAVCCRTVSRTGRMIDSTVVNKM